MSFLTKPWTIFHDIWHSVFDKLSNLGLKVRGFMVAYSISWWNRVTQTLSLDFKDVQSEWWSIVSFCCLKCSQIHNQTKGSSSWQHYTCYMNTRTTYFLQLWGFLEVLPANNDSTVVCLCQVNQENVVKVGHRQVVNMIRQGGNRLLIKVVTVSRNLDPDDTARKKGTKTCRFRVLHEGK